MANIDEYIKQIQQAQYGEEVRGSIVNALKKVNDDNNSYVAIKKEVVAAKDIVEEKANAAKETLTALQASTQIANEAKSSLNNIISSAISTKKELEQAVLETGEVIARVDNAKSNLDKSITSAGKAELNLQRQIETSNQIKNQLDVSNNTAIELKKNLDVAINEANTAKVKLVEAINNAGNAALEKIETAQSVATRAVETAKDAHVKAITTAGTTETKKVTDEGAKQVQAVQSIGTQETEKVTAEGTKQVGLVKTEGEKHLASVQTAAQGIITDREQINTNKEGVAQLKEDLSELSEENNALIGRVENLEKSGISGIDYDLNVKAINHRGYSTEAPENTIPAYILSKQKGFKYVECDVSFTKDGVAVLLHDSSIDRTSDGSGSISSLTYEQVLQYDFGSWFSDAFVGTKIPTFEEFIMTCKAIGLHPYVELKSNGGYTQEQITGIVNTVESCGMKGKVTYISFNATFLGYVKNADSRARLGYLADITEETIATANGLKTEENKVFMDVMYANASTTKVALCMENDLPVEIWTVNGENIILNMNPYVSGVTSDNLIAGKILYNKYMDYVAPEVPEITLSSISATYIGGDVTVGTALTDLTGITVTAKYSDDTSKNVTAYTLSGEIVEGSNTITVSYQGKTTTFTVTGVTTGGNEPDTPSETDYYEIWDFTTSATSNLGNEATLGVNASIDSDGLHLTSDSNAYARLTEYTSDIKAIEIDVAEIGEGAITTQHNRFVCSAFSYPPDATNPDTGLIYRNTGVWTIYGFDSNQNSSKAWGTDSALTDISEFANSTLRLELGDGTTSVYKDDVAIHQFDKSIGYIGKFFCLGAQSNSIKGTTITGFRTYK